jgi:lipopolysaccharide biosynthesis regulator YciM
MIAPAERRPMGLGSTAKKIQTVADRAEQLYKQLVDVRKRVMELEETADETGDRVATIETEQEKQRAVLDAIAEQQGIDVEQVLADAAIEDLDGDAAAEETATASDGGSAEGDDTAVAGDADIETATDSGNGDNQ